MTKQLREQRAKAVADARAIYAEADKASRQPTAEETQKFDAFMAEADRLKADIDRRERLDAEERALGESQGRKADPNAVGAVTREGLSSEERSIALATWLRVGSKAANLITDKDREIAHRAGLSLSSNEVEVRGLAPRAPRSAEEARALSVVTGSAGQFTVPDEAMRAMEVSLLAFGGMRENATVIRTSTGAPLPWPTSNDTSQKGAIVAENIAVSEQDIVFGQQSLDAYKYSSKMVRVPVELMQDSSINIAEFVGSRLGERLARILNEHFTTGTGTGQPNGIVTASSVGRTGTTGQTTSIIYDDLVELEHSVDPSYRPGAKFMMADSSLKVIKKLKDSQSRPLWVPGLAVREPDTILGYPYVINQDVAVMAANAKSVLFGQLSKYLIREVQEVTLLRLNERYAELHQVAFLAFLRADGDLIDAGTDPVKHYANSAT